MTLTPVSPEQDAFEALASEIWRSAADRLPPDVRWLAAVSPLAVRVPDSRLVWHPGLRVRAPGRLLRTLASEFVGAKLRGLGKLLLGGPRYEYSTSGKRGVGVLVISSALGDVAADGSFSTPYIEVSRSHEAVVFGPAGTCGESAEPVVLRRREALRVAARLTMAGLAGARSIPGPGRDRLLLLLEWLVWSLSMRWSHDAGLYSAVVARIADGDIRSIASVHEMNSIGRTLWIAAHRHGLLGIALQHAEITSGKRWYFPRVEERGGGVETPDVMYVYDGRLAEDLASYYPGARFELGCSSRYATWKTARGSSPPAEGVVLFVGALAPFDNEVVISALKRLVEEGREARLVLRLHPAAEVPPSCRAALDRMVASGAVELSEGRALAEDLDRARLVCGMSSTALEEALLLGRPAIQLTHPDYLEYIDLAGVRGALRVPCDELDSRALASAAFDAPDSAEIAERLGLRHAVVDHETILGAAGRPS